MIALDDVVLAQRIASVRSVNAAIDIAEEYASADDSGDVEDDGLGTSRDE